MRRAIFIGAVIGLLIVALVSIARADSPTITVDGVTYSAVKVTPANTIHFETPDTNPSAAFTDRHVWEGHGSEYLPCDGGIHWIDNANVLTISHCLETETTTTTTAPTTTTTVVETTTTTTTPTTTTSSPSTTTTAPVTTSSSVPPTTEPPTATTPPSAPPPTLPYTGLPDNASGLVLAGLALLSLGGVAVYAGRDR